MNIEIRHILFSAITLMEAVIIHFYFICFLGERYKKVFIHFITILIFFLTNSILSIYASGMAWITLSFYFFCFLYPLFLFSGNILQRLFASGLIIAYATITETVSLFLVSWIFNYSFSAIPIMNKMYFIAAFSSKLLLLLVVISITKMRKSELLKISISRLTLLLTIVLICTFFSYANVILATKHEAPISLIQLLEELGVFILSVLIFYIYERLVSASKKELHTELLAKQIEQDIRYFKYIDGYLCEIRSLKHDFTNHLTSMKLLLSKNEYSELEDYIDKYLNTVHAVISEIITGLPSVDAIIFFKKTIAIENKIEFNVSTENMTNIINPVHLNIILSNLLDNAIHACIQLTDVSMRKIDLLLKTEQDYLYIKVVNSSMPVCFAEGDLPKTTKPDKEHHGLGLETIKRLVHLYDGILYCNYSNKEFMFIARLKNIDKSSNLTDIN